MESNICILSIYMTKSIHYLLAFVLVIALIIGICPVLVVFSQPVIKDKNLKIDVLAKGLNSPTSMAFLGPKDILVVEKDDGIVNRIINGNVLPQPLLQIPVATKSERGLLGIDVAKHNNGPTYVFLYYTESGGGKTGDDVTDGIKPNDNVLYRYELINDHLINPKLLLKLPATPGPNHDGGKVLVGPDKNVYIVIGDLRSHRTQSQNVVNGPPVDNTSGILRVTQDGKAVQDAPLGDTSSLNLYYAYGIRNSFGMDFDPVTKKLWDTENGPNYGDEINLVEKGFNSGWAQVMGIWTPKGKIGNENAGKVNLHLPASLVNFEGKGKYREPAFIWFQTVAPTALKFFNSTKLGKQYQNDLFVGDYNNGNIYDFKLNENRTGLSLNDAKLNNNIAYSPNDYNPFIFASGFDGGISDIKVGPGDGYLYVLSLSGTIYRIVPSSSSSSSASG
jgi:aldose sugar dehydrogenase